MIPLPAACHLRRDTETSGCLLNTETLGTKYRVCNQTTPTHRQSSAAMTAAHCHQCEWPPGLASLRPEHTTWDTYKQFLNYSYQSIFMSNLWKYINVNLIKRWYRDHLLPRVSTNGNNRTARMEICAVPVLLKTHEPISTVLLKAYGTLLWNRVLLLIQILLYTHWPLY